MKKQFILMILTGIVFLSVVRSAAAKDLVGTDSSNLRGNSEVGTTSSEIKMTNWKNRANLEINARINSLNGLVTRIQSLKRLSDSNKTTLIGQVQSEIQIMQALLQKIQADTDLATLKTNLQSITKSFRIYLLFIPKIQILSAADRIDEIAGNMTTLVIKLQTKVSDQTTLSDAIAKIADAKIHSQKARDLVLPLQPDNGNQTIFDSNKVILKQARDEIKAGNVDLKAAMEDLRTIIKTLKTTGSVTPTLTPTGTIIPTP